MVKSSKPLAQRLPIPPGTRAFARARALDALAMVSARKNKRALQVPRVQNLYLHFLPDHREDVFESFILELMGTHQFLPYAEGVKRIKSGSIDRPYLTISFDDGFESNLRASRILANHGISACFFVCPRLVGLDREELEPYFPGSLGDETRSMNWEEVQTLLDMGHEVGSHTLTHPVLSEITLGEASEQIFESKVELEARIGEVVHFAWPRGRFHHFRKELVADVFQAGYGSCSSAIRGAHTTSGGERPCIRREHWDAEWPSSHMRYLLGHSVSNGDGAAGEWPQDWSELAGTRKD